MIERCECENACKVNREPDQTIRHVQTKTRKLQDDAQTHDIKISLETRKRIYTTTPVEDSSSCPTLQTAYNIQVLNTEIILLICLPSRRPGTLTAVAIWIPSSISQEITQRTNKYKILLHSEVVSMSCSVLYSCRASLAGVNKYSQPA